MSRPTNDELYDVIASAGSIRKAAPLIGVDERTVRRWLKAEEDPGPVAERPLKILAIDIETSPNLAYTWGIWNVNVGLNQIVKTGEMISFAAKFLGEPIEFRSDFHDGHEAMVHRAWELCDEADVLLHYNGKRFDVPHIQREFVLAGLRPPSPFKQIDLLKVVKAQFKFTSNKLAFIAPALGLESKVSHEGFGLWTKCMAGDAAAWERMREYNLQDVELLEQMYEKLLPWIPNHPSISAALGADVCPSCGSEDLIPDRYALLKTGKYQRFRCGGCGTYSRSTKRMAGTTISQVA